MVADNILSKAYRSKLKSVHPDKNIGNEIAANKRTDLLVNAWGRLKDPTFRRLYDNEMKVKLKVRTHTHTHTQIQHIHTYTYIHIHNRYRANRKFGAPHDYHIYAYTHKGLIATADD